MGFISAIVDFDNIVNLLPAASIVDGTKFGSNVKNRPVDKMKVAYCLAKRYGECLNGAFISDGSSTYYAGVALGQMAQNIRDIQTNNLAIYAELAKQNYPKSTGQSHCSVQIVKSALD